MLSKEIGSSAKIMIVISSLHQLNNLTRKHMKKLFTLEKLAALRNWRLPSAASFFVAINLLNNNLLRPTHEQTRRAPVVYLNALDKQERVDVN